MRRIGAWVAILSLALYLVFIGGGWRGTYEPNFRLLTTAITAAVLAVWLVAAWRSPAWRPTSSLWPAIIAMLASFAISTLASRFPRQSLDYLGSAILLAALYLLLVRILAEPFLRTRLQALIVAMTVVLGVAYAGANISHWLDWWGLVGHLAVPPLRPESESLTYGNPSAVMALVVLLGASALASLRWRSRWDVAVAGLVVGLGAFGIFVSGSRAGWLAVAIAIVAFVSTWLSDGLRRDRATRLARLWLARRRIRIVMGIGATGVVGALVLVAPSILRRASEGGEDLRLNFVVAAWRMFTEAPLFGTGPGTWVIQRIGYTIAPETDYYIPHAHNIYAQTLAELGLLGALAGVILVLALARLVGRALRDPDPIRRRWGWAAAFVVVYFAAHQLLDVFTNLPALMFAASLPIAWLDATATTPDAVAESRHRQTVWRWTISPGLWAAGVIAVVGVVAAANLGLFLSERVAAEHAAAVAAYNDGDWVRADELAVAADRQDPTWSPYLFTVGLAASAVGDHQRAVDAFRKVATTDDLPEAWLDLAAEELTLGHGGAAADALERSTRLGLQRPGIAMAIGDLALRLRETELATKAFALAIATTPSLAGDPWWQLDVRRTSVFPNAVDAAIDAQPDAAWQIALMAGQIDRSRTLASPGGPGSQSSLESIVVEAWQGDAGAFDRLRALCDEQPANTIAVTWAARIAGRRGDTAAQDHYLRWAYGASSVADELGRETRVSDKQLVGRTGTGELAEFWGTYTYRRPTPWNPLVGSLVQLELR